MKIFDYLTPDNPVAQGIVYLLLGLFFVWFALLAWSLIKNLSERQQIKSCEDAGKFLIQETSTRRDEGAPALSSPLEGEKIFSAFERTTGLKENSPIARHLRAIFDAGWNESQLDARGLIKNTTDKLFRANSLHRALLSIFIILGLLGTLFGLADTMSSLDMLLHGGTQLNNDTLGQGLQTLLGTLKGAFAPSILGVSLTVLGVVMFALYLRLVALPLGNLLERMTLTVWIPQLVPTASQKLLDKLQLSERQMQRSFAAAQEVAQFAEGIQSKTGAFSETLGHTTDALKQMTQIASHLGTFSQNFVEGVKVLTPFQQDLRTLYQQMVGESRAFQESVQRNIAGAENFQQRIQGQLDNQNEQLSQVLKALQSYEAAYIANRGQIDEKLSAVLGQAEQAFHSLSRRNEEITQALDEALGKPLRADLTNSLGAVESVLLAQLSQVESTLQVQLSSLGERLRELDAPLNTAATNFTETFINFNEHTDEWRTTLQREFAKQNETTQQQLRQLEGLSQQLPELLQQLTASSSNFSESSSNFAARGQQISENVNVLSQSVSGLSRSVDAFSEQISDQPGKGGDARLAELLAQQTRVLQELVEKIERLAASRPRNQPSPVIRPQAVDTSQAVITSQPVSPPKPRLGRRLSNWFWYGEW